MALIIVNPKTIVDKQKQWKNITKRTFYLKISLACSVLLNLILIYLNYNNYI
jgi:hypothetical protein